ncbi:hypothetical protein NHP190003_14370 [Helicobacter sp. NHP19-003]|uniref:Outer membrane protein n=1 Tax=Helicobacter gastrocanis TaxID=2849641 RepID=A0ABM7SKK0_9HELI|nr:hypothetical protein [Helicobacter sp. NHP19-003]BCZ18155.1 hypothetical protein NHP190003_14370 [Helicobacter sp. NHP19-003]
MRFLAFLLLLCGALSAEYGGIFVYTGGVYSQATLKAQATAKAGTHLSTPTPLSRFLLVGGLQFRAGLQAFHGG